MYLSISIYISVCTAATARAACTPKQKQVSEEKQATHTNKRQEQHHSTPHNTRHNKNNATQHTTQQEQHTHTNSERATNGRCELVTSPRAVSINQSKILTKPHTVNKIKTFQHHRGQQTLRHKVDQAWGAVHESQQHLVCATHSFTDSRGRTVAEG